MRRLLPRPKPWHLVALAVAASGAAAALVAAEARALAGDTNAAARLRGLAAFLLALSAGLSLLPLRWGWIALILFSVHLTSGFLLRRTAWAGGAPAAPEPVPIERRRRREGDLFQIAWGGACGAPAAGFAGAGFGLAYVLLLDHLVSTWVPSLWNRSSMLAGLIWVFMQFMICGAIVGGVLGARRPRSGSRVLGAALLGMTAAFFAVHATQTFLIDIPAFQQLRLLEEASAALFLSQFALWVFRLSATVIAGLGAAALAGPAEAPHPFPRVAAAVLASLLFVPWTIGLYAGRLSYDAILAGILLERGGHPEAARSLYTLGLAQHPEDKASSYLQFRIAMVHHRMKRDDDAKAALRQLVARPAKAPHQVELAEEYLRAWDRAPKGARRVTLPGVEMATEFKAGYCVPNSLSLVLRFWGSPDTAKEIGRRITSVDRGTEVQDSVWYVQNRGLRHFLLPMSSVEDIKSFIDEGLPVLIYIPQHVLAVIGYDDALDSLVTYDVAQEEIWVDHPISKLLPEWKGEKAVISLVLPEERFQKLPEVRRRRFESATAGHLHYLLHYPYHQLSDERSRELALAHLEASAAADPTKFYVLAHIFGRDQWGERPRRALQEKYDLKSAWLAGFTFARRDFADEETLRELSLSALDSGLGSQLRDFLEARRRDGSLSDQGDVLALLGELKMDDGQQSEAAAILGALEGDDRRPWSLARAQERSGAVPAARAGYRDIVQGPHVDPKYAAYYEQLEDQPKTGLAAWMGRRFKNPLDRLPEDLSMRRAALERLVSLRSDAPDQADLEAVEAFARDFPWEGEGQATYAEFLAARLEAPTVTPELRQTLTARLHRAAALTAAFEPGSAFAARAAAAERRAAAVRVSSR